MIYKDISEIFEDNSIIFPDKSRRTNENPWYSPPGWKGVFLKDIISETETKSMFSYHIVRIQEQCEVPEHDHATQWELNLIISGDGHFLLNGRDHPVKSGQTFVTPPGISHRVRAGDRDLVLLAIFVPPLA